MFTRQFLCHSSTTTIAQNASICASIVTSIWWGMVSQLIVSWGIKDCWCHHWTRVKIEGSNVNCINPCKLLFNTGTRVYVIEWRVRMSTKSFSPTLTAEPILSFPDSETQVAAQISHWHAQYLHSTWSSTLTRLSCRSLQGTHLLSMTSPLPLGTQWRSWLEPWWIHFLKCGTRHSGMDLHIYPLLKNCHRALSNTLTRRSWRVWVLSDTFG